MPPACKTNTWPNRGYLTGTFHRHHYHLHSISPGSGDRAADRNQSPSSRLSCFIKAVCSGDWYLLLPPSGQEPFGGDCGMEILINNKGIMPLVGTYGSCGLVGLSQLTILWEISSMGRAAPVRSFSLSGRWRDIKAEQEREKKRFAV